MYLTMSSAGRGAECAADNPFASHGVAQRVLFAAAATLAATRGLSTAAALSSPAHPTAATFAATVRGAWVLLSLAHCGFAVLPGVTEQSWG